MNKKEEILLREIIDYVYKNKTMPTRRYLQMKLGYKSINSITWYISSLLKQNYLTRNIDGKVVLNVLSKQYETGLKQINIINSIKDSVSLFLNKNKKYLAYKINHNYFNNIGILKNDILIVETNKKLKKNDIGLFIIDNKYRIMKYDYRDGFYILKDKEELILHKIKTIGKVIMVEKKL